VISEHAAPFKRLRAWLLRLAIGGTLLSGLLIAPLVVFKLAGRTSVTSVEDAPTRDVALVLGAGITARGVPSSVLEQRVQTAVALYKAGKVRKLLMSGDNSITSYDEVTAMKVSATKLGVEQDDILLDYAGFRTLDSCVRLRKVFGQRSALVVSQGFHLPRTLHLCRWAGINVTGVEAPDDRGRSRRMISGLREIPASMAAWFDCHVFGRQPKFLGPAIDVFNPPPEALNQPKRN
jgi:vancomycin permeability regulator SanA